MKSTSPATKIFELLEEDGAVGSLKKYIEIHDTIMCMMMQPGTSKLMQHVLPACKKTEKMELQTSMKHINDFCSATELADNEHVAFLAAM